MIIDTHAHLTDKSLAPEIRRFLDEAKAVGVDAVLTVGTKLETSRHCLQLAEEHREIRAAVGIHPNDCCTSGEGDWEQIVQLANHPRVAALGETGLDKYWDDCPWETQVDYFQRHWALSRETGLPVVIHTRDCAEEMLEVLQDEARKASDGKLSGVMHSFTGPQSVADACLELGLYISFAGMATFKNGTEILEIAKSTPEDRIMVETDSPYLTPHPMRGKRPNHPALVAHTLRHIANARGVDEQKFAKQTTANAIRLFGSW